MTIVLTAVIVTLVQLTGPQSTSWDALLGQWEYRQANRASATGYDPEGERIQFIRTDSGVVGFYFGLEREGEHGLFYSAVDVTHLTLSESGEVVFVVPGRHLYTERPVAVRKTDPATSAGHDGMELHFRGWIGEGHLVLQCTTKGGNCPDARMEFRRGHW